MSTPTWALTLAYWMHMLATVIWIGGLAALSIFVLPAARKSLDDAAFHSFLTDLQHRLDPLAWFSLGILAASGLIQMSANPNYGGFLAVQDLWSVAILIKHLLFLGMTAISAYMTWVLLPGLRRMAMKRTLTSQEEGSAGRADALSRREMGLLRLNLLLGVLVLGLTALARSAS